MGVIAAMDYAKNSCGLVISDQKGYKITKEFLLCPREGVFATKLKKILDRNAVELLVIGLPCNEDGSLSAQAKLLRCKIHDLRHILPKYCYCNEYGTSKEAARIRSYNLSKKHPDILAARLIFFRHIEELIDKNLPIN
jgi:RNase H-fold protein (predicted Holliday junction resolvase)